MCLIMILAGLYCSCQQVLTDTLRCQKSDANSYTTWNTGSDVAVFAVAVGVVK